MKLLKYLQNHLKRRVSTPYTQASLITRNMYIKKNACSEEQAEEVDKTPAESPT